MDNTVLVQNNGSEPVLVGDRYLQPRERRRVLRQPYEIAKSRHDCLALVGEEAQAEIPPAGQEDDTQAGQREEIEHPGEGEQVTMPAGGDVLPPVKTKRVKPQKKQTSSP